MKGTQYKKVGVWFSAVRQKPQEPYLLYINKYTFIARLQSSVRWQIDMQEAADAVLKHLAYENADNGCKKALDQICNHACVELSDYIKACVNIVLEQFKTDLIATSIAQQLQVARAAVKCFECRGSRTYQEGMTKGTKGQ